MTAFASQMKPKLKGKDMAIVQNGLTAQQARHMTDKAIRDKHAPEHDDRLNNILEGIERTSRLGESFLTVVFSRGIIDSLVMESLKSRGFKVEYPEVYDITIPFDVTIGW